MLSHRSQDYSQSLQQRPRLPEKLFENLQKHSNFTLLTRFVNTFQTKRRLSDDARIKKRSSVVFERPKVPILPRDEFAPKFKSRRCPKENLKSFIKFSTSDAIKASEMLIWVFQRRSVPIADLLIVISSKIWRGSESRQDGGNDWGSLKWVLRFCEAIHAERSLVLQQGRPGHGAVY